MNGPVEILLFEYLKESIESAASDDLLYELELHDTIHQPIRRDKGLRVGDSVGDFGPQAGGTLGEYDVMVVLVAYARLKGQDQQARQPALRAVYEIQRAACDLILNDSTLGGRVCDTLIRRGGRGYDVLDGEVYAVANIPLIINPSGARYAEN